MLFWNGMTVKGMRSGHERHDKTARPQNIFVNSGGRRVQKTSYKFLYNPRTLCESWNVITIGCVGRLTCSSDLEFFDWRYHRKERTRYGSSNMVKILTIGGALLAFHCSADRSSLRSSQSVATRFPPSLVFQRGAGRLIVQKVLTQKVLTANSRQSSPRFTMHDFDSVRIRDSSLSRISLAVSSANFLSPAISDRRRLGKFSPDSGSSPLDGACALRTLCSDPPTNQRPSRNNGSRARRLTGSGKSGSGTCRSAAQRCPAHGGNHTRDGVALGDKTASEHPVGTIAGVGVMQLPSF
jgi:hypothetical protein